MKYSILPASDLVRGQRCVPFASETQADAWRMVLERTDDGDDPTCSWSADGETLWRAWDGTAPWAVVEVTGCTLGGAEVVVAGPGVLPYGVDAMFVPKPSEVWTMPTPHADGAPWPALDAFLKKTSPAPIPTGPTYEWTSEPVHVGQRIDVTTSQGVIRGALCKAVHFDREHVGDEVVLRAKTVVWCVGPAEAEARACDVAPSAEGQALEWVR